ncbi:MAG: tRNA pseudouridine(38-40) synthase TruA [Limnochordaceae bacterium]|nr:tRNA pseudouridine(38-40) synthase TruA [Limnochordaceae bacterium]
MREQREAGEGAAPARNILLALEYDGRAFAGFQAQRRGRERPTVQEVLEEAILQTSGEVPRLVAAGRTDSGVHALGQVVNFLTRAHIPVDRWAAALNSRLPPTVRVWHSQEVPVQFHARYDAWSKVYRYRVKLGAPAGVFDTGRIWVIPEELDVEAMARAAALFVGRPYLRAFCAAGGKPVRDWRRRVDRCEFVADEPASELPGGAVSVHGRSRVRPGSTQAGQEGSGEVEVATFQRNSGHEWSLWVEAEGFLYHQVRTMMGTLVEVGRGRRTVESVAQLLNDPQARRRDAGPTAPADGLYLVAVGYPASKLSAR